MNTLVQITQEIYLKTFTMRIINFGFKAKFFITVIELSILTILLSHLYFDHKTERKYHQDEPSFTFNMRQNVKFDKQQTFTQEKDYEKEFDYPMYGNISVLIDQLERGETPGVDQYDNHNYSFLINNGQKCHSYMFEYVLPNQLKHYLPMKRSDVFLVILVKSAASNFNQRNMIRRTWGKEMSQYNHFRTKTMFTLGRPKESKVQATITKENDEYKDLIQGDFVDNYYNNTIKTLMTLRWVYEYCDTAKFYLFVDDDYYLSAKNLLLFLRNPYKFEEYFDHLGSRTNNFNRTNLFDKGG